MKVNWRRLFSISTSDTELFNESNNKFEFVGCNKKEYSCLSILPQVNNYFRESDIYFNDKDFYRALKAIENAYYKAGELTDMECVNCSAFFQASAIQSLESIHAELKSMTTGLFGTKRYIPQYQMAAQLLRKLKHKEDSEVTTFSPAMEPAYQH